MDNIDIIRELIDCIPEIKALFTTKNYSMFSTYNHTTGERETSSMPFQVIYQQPRFVEWKEQLYFELHKLEDDTFIAGILELLSNFSGWGDKSRFDKLESKLYVLKDHLDEYRAHYNNVQVVDDIRVPEKEICDKMLRAVSKLQRNHHYNRDSSEDTMNDYIRDILDESYIIKDQTRQGESESGNEAGEVDIQICMDGLPIVMIEGIKVASVERDRLSSHINKVLTKYDPNGCPYAFLIIYTTIKNFDSGYETIFDYFQKYDYPFPRESDLVNVDTGFGELKHSQIVLNRNGQKTRVHIWTVHIL